MTATGDARTGSGLPELIDAHLYMPFPFARSPYEREVTEGVGQWLRETGLAAEVTISFLLMTVILVATNTARLMRLTGVFAGLLVALYITVEAPLSGMSMNPARTVASALPGRLWQAAWIYFVGPTVGMLLAVEFYRRVRRVPEVICAKLNHHTHRRCIFCGHHEAGYGRAP